jgi:iron complex transport system permease protein
MLLEQVLPLPAIWTPTEAAAVLVLRLPRALLAGLVGASLAIAGGGFQAISRNPLADPFILGVSSGAAFGVVVAVLLGVGPGGAGAVLAPLFGFAGALLAALVVYRLASVDARLPVETLLLAGVAVSLFFASAIMLVSALVPAVELQGIVFSLMGNLAPRGPAAVAAVAAFLAVGSAVMLAVAQPLNVLALGEEAAAALGVEVERVKRAVFVAASLVTGAAVSVSGSIAFVGLMVPHAARLLFGPDNRVLLPASLLMGAIFLMAADVVARLVTAPAELPVGVITAFCGAPFFAVLLRRRARGGAR